MIKKLVLLAGLTLTFVITVSAELPFPSCMPTCRESSLKR